MGGLTRIVCGLGMLAWVGAAALAVPDTPASGEAERLLDRIIADQQAAQARDRAEADRLINAAMQSFKEGGYIAARETLERALRLDPANAAGRSLLASVEAKLTPRKAEPPAAAAPEPLDEEQLRVALLEGRRLLDDGQRLAAIEVLENVQQAIVLAPAGVNLAPYRAEAAMALALARKNPEGEAERKPTKVPTEFNPDGTRRKGELGPVPAPTVVETERRMITPDREDARHWAKPSTYLEEFDFAAGELAVRPMGPPPLIRYPDDWKEKSERRLAQATGWPKWYRDLQAKLAQPLSSKVDFKGVTLTQALTFLRDLSGVNIVVDPAVQAAGLDQNKVTFEVGRVTLESALNLVAEMTGTEYLLHNEVVWFTTPERAKTYKVTKVYNISDLVMPRTNHLEWHPLRPPDSWEADPWWDRYLDWYDRWGGWSGNSGAGFPPAFWPPRYMHGETREGNAERLYDLIERVLGPVERD